MSNKVTISRSTSEERTRTAIQNFIQISNLSKSFHSNGKSCEVLTDVQISLVEGSITAFMGRSGAGKTTLLRCLNLLETPSFGKIRIAGQDLTALSDAELRLFRQNIGMVFQSFNLLSNCSVFKNIALPLEILKVPRKKIVSQVNEIASLVGLEGKLSHFPSQLSGGQKQRVAIARALVGDSKLLLCDEFTSALDPDTRLEMVELVRDIRNRLGVTVVMVSHDMSIIEDLCDFVVVLEKGRIVEQGETREIFRSPQHSSTRSLLSRHKSNFATSQTLQSVPTASVVSTGV